MAKRKVPTGRFIWMNEADSFTGEPKTVYPAL
jgi:hypothetical protein